MTNQRINSGAHGFSCLVLNLTSPTPMTLCPEALFQFSIPQKQKVQCPTFISFQSQASISAKNIFEVMDLQQAR